MRREVAKQAAQAEADVLCDVRKMSPSLKQKGGWSDFSQTSDLARISLDGVTVSGGRVTELALVDCSLKGELSVTDIFSVLQLQML